MTGHATNTDGNDGPVQGSDLLHRNATMLCAGYVTGALLGSSPAVQLVGEQIDPLDAEFDLPPFGRCRVRVTATDATDDRSCIDRMIEAVDLHVRNRADGWIAGTEAEFLAALRAEVRQIAGIA